MVSDQTDPRPKSVHPQLLIKPFPIHFHTASPDTLHTIVRTFVPSKLLLIRIQSSRRLLLIKLPSLKSQTKPPTIAPSSDLYLCSDSYRTKSPLIRLLCNHFLGDFCEVNKFYANLARPIF